MTFLPLRTLVCSPYAGDIQRNTHYARDCMKDSLDRGEAPFLSHLLYTQVLLDGVPEERELGLRCEQAWLQSAEQLVLYLDLGLTPGMTLTIDRWADLKPGLTAFVHARRLGEPWSR